ncbi:uncharacterized protein METZ01_LOCUS344011, partial [marine metagenome]
QGCHRRIVHRFRYHLAWIGWFDCRANDRHVPQKTGVPDSRRMQRVLPILRSLKTSSRKGWGCPRQGRAL